VGQVVDVFLQVITGGLHGIRLTERETSNADQGTICKAIETSVLVARNQRAFIRKGKWSQGVESQMEIEGT
jgi:hypothetical protein